MSDNLLGTYLVVFKYPCQNPLRQISVSRCYYPNNKTNPCPCPRHYKAWVRRAVLNSKHDWQPRHDLDASERNSTGKALSSPTKLRQTVHRDLVRLLLLLDLTSCWWRVSGIAQADATPMAAFWRVDIDPGSFWGLFPLLKAVE